MKRAATASGFSLIEIVLVVAIIGTLAAVISLPFARFRQAQAIENSTDAVVAVLNEARTKTLGAVDNTSYGVHFESDKIILFAGTSYTSGAATNQSTPLESPVTMSALSLAGGGSEIHFDRLKGTTSQHGTITLTLPSGQARTITVAATGTVARN